MPISEWQRPELDDRLITICIPTHRRPSLLMHCLHSCLIQDYRPLEIDVSDNSPADDTRTLVESLTPPDGISLRYWRNSPPIGPVENQRKLFAAVRGRRFVWMNDDDALVGGAVSAMASSFEWGSDVIVSYGIEQVMNQAGEIQREVSARWNAYYDQLPEGAGLRRDLLVCAFRKQMPHVGFLIMTEAARRVGIRDRAEVGLAIDTDFAIRLGQTYRGSAHAFIDRVTIQTRMDFSTLSWTAQDVCWKFYNVVSTINDLSAEEARARDDLLRRLGPQALREHSFAHRRKAALRILLSNTYRQHVGPIRMAYSAVLIAFPRIAFAMRSMLRDSLDWLPPAPPRNEGEIAVGKDVSPRERLNKPAL